MIVCLCAFTTAGRRLADRLRELFADDLIVERRENEPLSDWVRLAFERRADIVFVGAVGIAVRSIAPFAVDKTTDPGVVVVDEQARFVIPILSGHLGGANELAVRVAKFLRATPVVTTATDVNALFAVDVFAKKNRFHIEDRSGIQKISAKLLRGEKITVAVDPRVKISAAQIPEELQLVGFDRAADVDLLISARSRFNVDAFERSNDPYDRQDRSHAFQSQCVPLTTRAEEEPSRRKALLELTPKRFAVGFGCKKGVTALEFESFFNAFIETVPLALVGEERGECERTIVDAFWRETAGFASIELKRYEFGPLEFVQKLGLPMRFYSASELQAAQGEFARSKFVEATTGVDNVCERAAVLLAGVNGRLIVKKTARNGITAAVADAQPEITQWTF